MEIKMVTNKKRMTISLSDSVVDLLVAAENKMGLSKSAIISVALNEWATNHPEHVEKKGNE